MTFIRLQYTLGARYHFFYCGTACSDNLYYGMPDASFGNTYGTATVMATRAALIAALLQKTLDQR